MTSPTAASRSRLVAPDLARGFALLGIAWANISSAWAIPPGNMAGAMLGGVGDTLLDAPSVVASATFAHVRGLPMFTTLLGFGIGLLWLSLTRREYPEKNRRRLLYRRYGFLALFGLIHLVFIFFGDIMLTYGLLGLLVIALTRFDDKTLLILSGVLFAIPTLGTASTLLFTSPELLSTDPMKFLPDFADYPGYLLASLLVLLTVILGAPMYILTLMPLMLVGFVAARRGVHRHPEKYIRVLTGWVIVAAVVMLTIGLPWGLAEVGVLPNEWAPYFMNANQTLGMLTGPGIAAGILLACRRLQRSLDAGSPLPLPVAMLVALGKRSMTGYLLQSVIFFVVCLPFTLNLASDVGAFGQFLVALGTWLATLVFCWLLEKAGKPGPFEKVHRLLSYGRNGLPDRFPHADAHAASTGESGDASAKS